MECIGGMAMRRIIAATALVFTLGMASGSSAQEQRYQAWQGSSARLQELIKELKPLVDRGRQQRLADPRFLNDLEVVLGRYESQGGVTALSDDFADGDYTRNPAWRRRPLRRPRPHLRLRGRSTRAISPPASMPSAAAMQTPRPAASGPSTTIRRPNGPRT